MVEVDNGGSFVRGRHVCSVEWTGLCAGKMGSRTAMSKAQLNHGFKAPNLACRLVLPLRAASRKEFRRR